ncbi:MFS transporter [Bifidobacterium eulemuris]|uniref:Transporter n=1 Tax=Bifidobacterium eulemuris TaxID=1765219 RepID=A0A261G0R3_9BIFI|nr:MFS transporter [Bifidobacterium eulemuris]OZG65034.1 transporter [Bifidobacterium eulemuris]QOL32853.1 MFS transporter [Bifidobacterium eulemuris]
MTLNEESSTTRTAAATATVSNLAPDTGRPLSSREKIRFGVGFALFSLIWMTAGTSGSAVLLPQRFTELGIGVPEVILGTMNSVGCVFALVANVVFGALSDITRSRFGKRTPWIVVGGFITAAGYVLASQSVDLFGIVAGWSVVQVGVNMMIAPAVAVLSDRIPESTRGTFSAFYGGAQIVGQSAGTFLGAQFIEKMGQGFMVGVALFAITGVVTVLVWPRERSSKASDPSSDGGTAARLDAKAILRSFVPPTRNCRDFYLALVGRLMLILGWSMIQGYQLYILQKYCGQTTEESAATISTMSVVSMVVLIITSVVSGPISDLLHRRKIIVAIGSVIIAVGIAIPWFMPTGFGMVLFAGVGGFGYGIYIAVDQALNVDVLPSQEEAGKDLGILNLANTVGQVLAPVIVGAIVVATGSYATLFPIALASVLAGAVVIMFIRKVR